MLNSWSVRIQTRQNGAIGIFEWREYNVYAETEEQARDAARLLAHGENFETCGSVATCKESAV
jgi:hypothetical protein